VILDDLLKLGLITKVFHKGGFTIRIKNEKYAKLIEKMNICYSQKTPTATPMSPHEAMAAAAAAGTINLNNQQWPTPKQYVLNSNETNNNDHHHTRETPSPEFAVFKMGKKDIVLFLFFSFFLLYCSTYYTYYYDLIT